MLNKQTAIESIYQLKVDPSLYSAMLNYVARGYSVIPVYENKRPAIPSWKEFQFRYATPDEMREWCNDPKVTGLGIVCGSLSGITVADFDNAEAAAKFRREYPHLADTYTVRSATRRTPHFYYQLSDTLRNERKQAGANGDLIANGGYTITAPSMVNGSQYEVENDTAIRVITRADYEIIKQALDVATRAESAPVVISRSAISGDALELFAHHTKIYTSRNLGMYHTMRYLLARGWTPDEIRDTLKQTFIDAPAVTTHRPEKPSTRASEFEQILKSAQKTPLKKYTGNGIPNSVRETLMQLGETVGARVLDGLMLAGIDHDTLYTERDLVELLKDSDIPIGRKAVRSLLEIQLGEKQLCPQFSAIQQLETNNVCLAEKREQNTKGRKPANFYRIPSPLELVDILKVEETPAHSLKPDDLRTSKSYRVALHAAVIRNNPDKEFTRSWLASRLGVSKRSTRNYDAKAGYKSIVQKDEKPLTFAQVQSLPDAGAFGYIEINGKAYAPEIKHRLTFIRALEAGKRVVWVKYACIKFIPNTESVRQETAENSAKIQRNRREFEKVAKAHRDLRNSKKKVQKEATDTPQPQDTMPAVTPKTPEIAPQRDIDPLLKLGASIGATITPASGSGARQ